MIRIDGVDCGVTKQGNPYKKSSTGKKVGATVGAASYVASALFVPYQTMANVANKISPVLGKPFSQIATSAVNEGGKRGLDFVKKIINSSKEFKLLDKLMCKASALSFKHPSSKTATWVYEFAHKMASSKVAKAGLAGVALLAALGVGAAIFAGIGCLVGSAFDKIKESGAKAEADRRADFDAKWQ